MVEKKSKEVTHKIKEQQDEENQSFSLHFGNLKHLIMTFTIQSRIIVVIYVLLLTKKYKIKKYIKRK